MTASKKDKAALPSQPQPFSELNIPPRVDWPVSVGEQMTYARSRGRILCPPPILGTLEWDRQQNPFPDIGLSSESPVGIAPTGARGQPPNQRLS